MIRVEPLPIFETSIHAISIGFTLQVRSWKSNFIGGAEFANSPPRFRGNSGQLAYFFFLFLFFVFVEIFPKYLLLQIYFTEIDTKTLRNAICHSLIFIQHASLLKHLSLSQFIESSSSSKKSFSKAALFRGVWCVCTLSFIFSYLTCI